MEIKQKTSRNGELEIFPLKIDCLPQELLEQIFSFLSKEDLQATMCVNQNISIRVKIAANFIETTAIKNFIYILIQKLNAEKFPKQIELFLEISQKVNFPNFVNLLLLKKNILDIKAQSINVTKTLDTKSVSDLRDYVHLPHFFEDIFELVEFERQIDAANLITNIVERNFVLLDIIRALIQAGYIDKAITVALSISLEGKRIFSLVDIAKALKQAGHIDKLLSIVSSIYFQGRFIPPYIDVANDLIEAGHPDKLLSLFSSIYFQGRFIHSCIDVANDLIEAGHSDIVFSLISSISSESLRCKILDSIQDALKRADYLERAKSFPKEKLKEPTLENVHKALIEDKIDRAIDIAELIDDEIVHAKALGNISIALAKKGDIERAIDVAASIHEEFVNGDVLTYISKILAEEGDIERATDVAKLIRDSFSRDRALKDIGFYM